MKTPRGTARALRRAGVFPPDTVWVPYCPSCNRLGPRPMPGLCGECTLVIENNKLYCNYEVRT